MRGARPSVLRLALDGLRSVSGLRHFCAVWAAAFLAVFLTVLAGGAAQAQQLIVNPDFETSPPPNFGNNINWPIAPWILGTGNRSNVVKVDGPGGFNYNTSGPESDADAPGAGINQHYLDIASGSNDFYQAFTVPLCANGSTTPDATYVTSGAFSTRDNLAGTGTIALREGTGPSGTLVPGSLNSDSLPANSTLTGGWSVVGSTVGLTAGQTYSFVVTMDNNVNFDNGTVTFQGLQCPAMEVNKSTTSTPRAAGDTLVYTFEVINISTPSALEVNDVTVTDPNCATTPTLVSATVTADTTLQAGETQVYTCTSVPVTQAQVDARAVPNTVIVDGVPTDGILVPATDTVTTPVFVDIVANDDDFTGAPVPGFLGGPSGNVLPNDELQGNIPASGDVTIAVLADGGLTGVTIATDGTLNVPAGTPPGTYQVEYEICDALNTANCDSAFATVLVVGIEAVDDSFGPVAGASGGTTPSVLGNDTLNGSPVVPSAVALTPGTAPAPAAGSITMNPVTGVITVAAGTTPGTYTYPYEICEIISGAPSTNCASAVATVVVGIGIDAQDDNLTGTPVDPVTGGAAGNVLTDNGNGPDTLNGVAITNPALITIAVTDPDGLTGVTIGADGTLTVPPGSTPGAYQVAYEICEVANPLNCATAIATVVVGTGIVAENDDLTGTPIDPVTGGDAGNVLLDNGNGADTLNGVDITNPALITISVTDPDGLTGVTIAADGTLTVPPGSTAGSYQVVYEICEVAAPVNCSTAIATVVVGAGIQAQDDNLTGTPIDPVAGGVAGNVLAGNGNGADTLNGVAITDPTLITIAVTDPDGLTGVTIGADGTLTVPPGSAPGSYQVVYQICEVAAPANCSTAIATVVVGAGIVAEDDDLTATPVAAGAGGIAGNVLTDNGNGADTLNGVDITNPALVTIAVTNPGGLTGVTIGADGALTVPPGTVPGTYSVEYEICEVAAPANCATATATVLVLDAGDPGLVDDTSSGNIPGSAVTIQVLTNDDDPANIFDPATLTIVGTSGPGQPLVVPGQGTWTVDLATGSITFTPEPGFTGNPTPISYQVTDIFGNLLAPAEVVVLYEFTAAFVCSDVIGKVFDDRNQDGRQDEGEPGIAGAHLATVNGDIITTDEYGRYSVPCAAIPEDIGSTFLLKLDPRSLPTGYRLTTENPKTVRLTQGTMRRMNFGVTLSNVVRVDLTDAAFDAKGEISADLDKGLQALVAAVAKKPSVVRLSYFADGGDTELAKDRLDDVEDRLRDLWRGQGKYQLSLEKTVVERE
jgi:CshA-type fibril repeat protein